MTREETVMKVALVVNKIGQDIEINIENIIAYINEAADKGADLILFPETAVTGIINNDNPEHDIKLGMSIPSKTIDLFCETAKKRKINVAIGIFELENGSLYDTAIFINRGGEIGLKYRRMSKGWHSPKSDMNFYKEGSEVGSYESDIGKVCFLICGDLYDQHFLEEVKRIKPDYFLYPYARCFYEGNIDNEKWEKEEMDDYINKIKETGATALMTNYLDEHYFGGAFVVTPEGKRLGSLGLGKEGILLVEV